MKIILDNIRMNNIKNNKPISVNVSKENAESRAPLKSIPIIYQQEETVTFK